ncbi:hypothetical protein [Sorangium sp. So ce1151]|uniref:hypothetical protein n=1 Tax=Sorangium sp. So ce1151 TaxID=3133332 RepID=UPI003F60B18B
MSDTRCGGSHVNGRYVVEFTNTQNRQFIIGADTPIINEWSVDEEFCEGIYVDAEVYSLESGVWVRSGALRGEGVWSGGGEFWDCRIDARFNRVSRAPAHSSRYRVVAEAGWKYGCEEERVTFDYCFPDYGCDSADFMVETGCSYSPLPVSVWIEPTD